jgi:glycerol kinase
MGAGLLTFFMQFHTEVLGKRIVRPADVETTALGAAYLAGLATWYFRSLDEVERFWRADQAARRFVRAIARCRQR